MKYTMYKKGLAPFHTEYAIMADRMKGLGWTFENPEDNLDSVEEPKEDSQIEGTEGKVTVFQALMKKKKEKFAATNEQSNLITA